MRYILPLIFTTFILIGCKTDEPQNPPTVNTNSATEIQLKSVLLNGEVIDEGFSTATERGFVYSEKNSNPSVSDNKLISGYGKGKFSIALSDLIPNTKYYYRAFATNTKGVTYGEVMNVTTLDYSLPKLNTNLPTDITEQSARITGTWVDTGGGTIMDAGFAVSKTSGPTKENSLGNWSGGGGANYITSGTIIGNLSANTKYFIRAYAKNVKGFTYGNEVFFTTTDFAKPGLFTNNYFVNKDNSVSLRGDIYNLGGGNYIDGGFVLSTKPNPTFSDIKISVPLTTIGIFTGTTNKLNAKTKYYVKAYVTNEKFTSFGNELSFTTF